ncbi:MAG: hemagluttinin repeat-containing protein, partial [Bacteroidetes bacterium]|nr:hemagluttinin repeat-containing protein [Bacteroidota bacterium]
MTKTKSLACFVCLLIAVNSPALAQYWTSQSTSTTAALNSVKAVNASTAWVCGASGTILRTTDGGATWAKLSAPLASIGYSFYSVEALDANTAWVAGGNGTNSSGLFKTTNGGLSWVQQMSSVTAGTFYNVVLFTDANNGILFGDPEGGYFVVYSTANGGSSWTRTSQTNIPAPLFGEVGLSNNLAISGNTVIFGTGMSQTTPATRVFRSTDRGKSWTASSV